MQVSDSTKEVAEERVRHAGRIFDDGSAVDVEFTEEKNPRLSDAKYTVEITSSAAGHIVRIEAEAPEERAALDMAADKYERQLRRLKERLIQRNRQAKKDLNLGLDTSDGGKDRDGTIVRTKRFEMKPMTAEEAAL
ncbi:MAG: ribosome-associated translation inhibitor RaiA, partial [Acidimicrobiia bacterium]|nr:ribosome-associated translation inhibitor RaiA [Acidimicrobiia bacterium]